MGPFDEAFGLTLLGSLIRHVCAKCPFRGLKTKPISQLKHSLSSKLLITYFFCYMPCYISSSLGRWGAGIVSDMEASACESINLLRSTYVLGTIIGIPQIRGLGEA